jgi:hypothetical protein
VLRGCGRDVSRGCPDGSRGCPSGSCCCPGGDDASGAGPASSHHRRSGRNGGASPALPRSGPEPVAAACWPCPGAVAAACRSVLGLGFGLVAAACRSVPELGFGAVAAACRPTPGFGGALGPLSGTGPPGAGGCGEASPAPGGSSAGGASNPVLFAVGRNHRPDSPAGATPSVEAAVPSLAALPGPAVPAVLAAPSGLAVPSLAVPSLAVPSLPVLPASGVPPAGDVPSARGAGSGPSEASGADRKATSASVNSVPALPSPAISSSPAALPSSTVPLPPAAPPSPVTPPSPVFLATPPSPVTRSPAAPGAVSAAGRPAGPALSWESQDAPPASAVRSCGPASQVMPSLPSLPGSSATDFPLPSSVAGRRDGTRLKYRPGRALRTNTRVVRKWSAILIVPVQRVMTAPRARPYLESRCPALRGRSKPSERAGDGPAGAGTRLGTSTKRPGIITRLGTSTMRLGTGTRPRNATLPQSAAASNPHHKASSRSHLVRRCGARSHSARGT